jgi:hypothetical protein
LTNHAGDKLCFRNTTDATKDFALINGFKYFMKTFLYKLPSNMFFYVNVMNVNTSVVFEWTSNEFGAYNQHPYVLDNRVSVKNHLAQ